MASSRTNAEAPICVTCGTQFDSSWPATHCPICEDERQYIGLGGQRWTTLNDLRIGHRNAFTLEEPGLHSIHTEPSFAIDQRAFLVRSAEGNLLWDCVALIDDSTLTEIRNLGDLSAIAVSHPHYYTTVVEWSDSFGGVPIYLHEADRRWVQRGGANIKFWAGETKRLFGQLGLVRCGGHFEGFQVLHWPSGAGGRGALLAGDQPQVAMDRHWVSFLYSYPNMVPLGAPAIRRIVRSLEPLEFDRIYGAFGRHVMSDAKRVVQRSAERYLSRIGAPALGAYTEPDDQLVVEIHVRDVEASARFYRTFGFQLLRTEPDFAELLWDKSRLLLQGVACQPEPPGTVIANMRIMVPDVERYWHMVQEMGLHVVRTLGERDYGLREFTVVSPDGLGLRFATRL